ncbi:MAG: amidase [Nevskia sp.]|nr:amidase [Nevskia sp.]
MGNADLELCYLGAAEAIAAFKARRISPVEVLQAQIARVEAVNDKLNVLTYKYFDRALEQAKAAEKVYMNPAATPRPLEGLSCAIKDWHSVKGEITTYGSKVYRDFRPDQTAPTVQRLLDAGAIMHCRTTTPEFAHSGITHSPLWGVSRNPWNTRYSPGGSSGGAGASLAAGFTTLADGTDGGGSVRIPASINGVYGYKAPWARNPTDREHPGETLLHYGPLARSVADAALMQNVMSGPHPDDLYSLRDRVVLPASFEGIKGWRVALSMDLGYFEVDPEVQANTRAAAERFRSLGCEVEEVDLGWTDEVEKSWRITWESLFHALAGNLLPQWRNELDPFVVKILENGARHTVADFYAMHRVRYEMYARLEPILQRCNVLICPTAAIPSCVAERSNEDPLVINGKQRTPYTGWFMTYPFNMLSQCPVMSVPSGFSPSTGVPTGLQIVGRTYDDLSVFRAAAALESAGSHWKERQRPAL